MSGKGKNNQATAPAPKSKKNARKVTKNAQKEQKLINLTSEENSSASDTETRPLPVKIDRSLKEGLKTNILELRRKPLWTKTLLLLHLPLQLLQQLQIILSPRTRILRRKRSQEVFHQNQLIYLILIKKISLVL